MRQSEGQTTEMTHAAGNPEPAPHRKFFCGIESILRRLREQKEAVSPEPPREQRTDGWGARIS